MVHYNDAEKGTYLRIRNNKYATANCYGWTTTANSININNYDYLHVHIRESYWGYTFGTSYETQQCWIYLYDDNYGEYYAKSFRNSSETIWTFDLKGRTGNLRVRFNLAPYSHIDIYSIKLSNKAI